MTNEETRSPRSEPLSLASGASGPAGLRSMTEVADKVVDLHDVSVMVPGRTLLDGVEWHVRAGERWVPLGPNGRGKTSLVSVAATYLWPSFGARCQS